MNVNIKLVCTPSVSVLCVSVCMPQGCILMHVLWCLMVSQINDLWYLAQLIIFMPLVLSCMYHTHSHYGSFGFSMVLFRFLGWDTWMGCYLWDPFKGILQGSPMDIKIIDFIYLLPSRNAEGGKHTIWIKLINKSKAPIGNLCAHNFKVRTKHKWLRQWMN